MRMENKRGDRGRFCVSVKVSESFSVNRIS